MFIDCNSVDHQGKESEIIEILGVYHHSGVFHTSCFWHRECGTFGVV